MPTPRGSPMRNRLFSCVPGVALSLLAVSPALGQAVKPADQSASGGTHRMVIYNGTTRTTAYFAPGASTADQNALRDVDRAGAETAQAADLVNDLRDARLQRAKTEAA